MRRTDLQAMSSAKVEDAILLLNHKRWSNSYYLAGYAIELGLKACISRQISSDTIPDKAILRDVLTHEFLKLVGLAGLRADLKLRQSEDVEFAANWALVSEWSPDDRYTSKTSLEATYLVSAVTDENHGVLPWIKTFW